MATDKTKRAPGLTDAQLAEYLDAGMTGKDIMERVQIASSTLYRRINRLRPNTVAQQMIPAYTAQRTQHQIHAMAELTKSLDRINLLMDACDRWLRDPNNPDQYDIGPRSEEVDIIYEVEVEHGDGLLHMEKRKRPLNEILAEIEHIDDERVSSFKRADLKRADPRDTILKTAQEIRMTVHQAAELARLLVDVRSLDLFRRALVQAIKEVDPDVAQRIALALQRTAVFHCIAEGPGSVFAAQDDGDRPAGGD